MKRFTRQLETKLNYFKITKFITKYIHYIHNTKYKIFYLFVKNV